MRVNQVPCPKCGASLKSKAGIPVGSSVTCPKCSRKFTVEKDPAEVIDDAELEEADDTPRRKKGPPPAPARRRADRDPEDDEDDADEEDEPRPRKKSVSAKADRRRPRDEDDEEDDRPRKKKRKRRAADTEESLYWRLRHNIWVRVITLAVLLGILAVLAYLLYEKRKFEAAENEGFSGSAPAPAVALGGPQSASTGGPG